MKKLSFFLMAMLVSLTSFAAALGDGYEKVTNISTLVAGDKVVIYCDDASIGVTGWNGSKDATVAADGWVEYLVETGTGGVYLKDEGKSQYIAKPGGNAFKYGTKAICTVDKNGVLTCDSRYLCYNSQNGTYYRMYTAIGSYKPFYVYKVVETVTPGEASISVNAGTVDFGAVKVTELESVEPKTLTVTGADLTEGIIVSLSDQNFTINVTELPKEGGDITIAPATNLDPDAYETTLTLTSGTTTQTVTLSVNVKDVYTITWNALGSTTTTTVVQGDKLVLPEAPTCEYKTFVGWATNAEVSADGSDIVFVNDFTTPTASTTYYAVFAILSEDVAAETTGKYTISNYPAGTQYAKNEEHKLDDDVTIYTTLCHFTTELRIYSSSTNNGYVVSNELPGTIKSMTFNAGNKADNLVVYGSTDGADWSEVGKIATQETYADYTLSFGETNYTYFKLDVEGTNQVRVKTFSITYLAPTYTDYSTTCVAPVVNHTITVSANPAEGGVVTGGGEFKETDEITVKAVANDGYEFVNWTENEVEVSTDAEYTFEVLADRALVANFKKAAPATETVYFIDVKKWGKVNAYAWTTDPIVAWPGAAATKEAEQIAGYDVYSYTLDAGAAANVIFNDGSSQTPDLVWTVGKYYVIDMGWLTKEEAETKLAAPLPEVWTVVGAKGLMGTDWNLNDASNNMTLQEDGTYLLEKKDITLSAGTKYEYKAAKDHGWTVAVPQDGNQTLTISTSGIYDVTFVLNVTAKKLTATATLKQEEVIIPTIQVAGDMTSWGDAPVTLVMAADSLTATATIKLDAKTYEFKMIVGGNWQSDAKTVNRDNNSTVFTGANSDTNTKLVADQAGDYIFTWTYETKTLTVTYPALPVKYNVTVTAENGTVTGAGEYEEGATATLTATANEGYEFVNWTVGEEVVSTENPYSFVVTADIALVVNFIPVVEPEKPEPTYTENNLNPYAFGLESVLSEDKTTLTVTYRLNNSKATSVNVVIYNGEEVVATVPGTTTIGKNIVEISTADLPGGVELKWAVEVNGTSVAAPTAETKIYSFYHPSGLDIDINPENETFGMLLVNEGMHSVKSKTEGYVSAQFGAGIFAFTPSFDLIPNGELPGYNGGVEFTEGRADAAGSTAYAPRRIRISEDGRIFVTSLNTDGNYLWEVNADNLNEWTPVFKGTLNDQRELITEDSAFIAAPNNGFDVKGSGENLQLAMYSVNLSGITAAAMSGFRLHEYNLGTATEWTTAPSKAIVEGKYAINYTGTQVEYDNEGGLWIASYRGTASDANPGLVHINADGVEDAKLVWNNVRQAGIRFNKDFTKLVVAGNNGAAKKATIYTISKDANGAPVLTQEAVVDMAAVGNNLNDFAWDYAGNLYSCGNTAEKLAAWAMPYSGKVETPAAAKYAFQLEGEAVEYTEIVMSNLVVTPYGAYDLLEASDGTTGIAVTLGVDADGKLVEGSDVSWNGTSMTILSSGVFTKAYNDELATDVYNGKLVIDFMGSPMGLDLYMYGTGAAASVDVVITDANIAVDEWGSYVVTANWGEGTLTCEVSDTEYEGFMMIEYTITEDDWYIWMAYTATVTTVDNVMTIEGEFTDNYTGTTYNVTISGDLNNTGTGLDNATVTIKPVKMIKNGQLIIEKDGVQYNANGAIIK